MFSGSYFFWAMGIKICRFHWMRTVLMKVVEVRGRCFDKCAGGYSDFFLNVYSGSYKRK